MIYNKGDVFPSAILRIELEGVFEGFAELISTESRELASMQSEESPMIGSSRWLIRFVELEDCPELNPKERMTQLHRRGMMCHRVIRRRLGSFSANYRKYANPEIGDNLGSENLDDSFIMESF